MLWIEAKYVNIIGTRLRNFKRKSEYLWNFSCCFCGDSKTRKNAARGYVYRKGDKLNYDCKKCGIGMSVKNFVKRLDPELYSEMIFEMFIPPKREELPSFKPERPVFDKSYDPFKILKKVGDLPKDHFCRQFIEKRCIPLHAWDDLYFTPYFYTWCGEVLPGRYKVPKSKQDDEPRLIIPFRNMKGEVTAFQGRQLVGDDKGQKYVYLALTKDEPLVWGLNNIDPNKPVYVLEGPFDAMFIPNAIACGGSELTGDLSRLDIPKENFVIVYDNEPRSPHTIKKMKTAIERGYKVCIWPEYCIKEKDINDMVLARVEKWGLPTSCEYIFLRIKDGTYLGISASLALADWKKVSDQALLDMDKKRSYPK